MCKKLWQKLFPPTLVAQPPPQQKWDKGEEKQVKSPEQPKPQYQPKPQQPKPQQSKPTPDIKPIKTEIKSTGKPENRGQRRGKGKR